MKQSYVRYQPCLASGNIENCPVPTWLCSLCVFYTIKRNILSTNPVIRRIRAVAIHNTEKLSQDTLYPQEKNRTLSIKIPPHQMCTEFPATLSRYTQIVSSLCNWRRDWFPKDLLHSDIVFWNKERNEFIQIQNGVLGSACKNMTVLLTLSTLVTCRKNVKTHAESGL